jgi:hypothetical protein
MILKKTTLPNRIDNLEGKIIGVAQVKKPQLDTIDVKICVSALAELHA